VSYSDQLLEAARIKLMENLKHLSAEDRQFIQQRFGVLLSDPPSSDELDALAKIWLEEIASVEGDPTARARQP
jgi:hypothetical protein